MTEKLEKNELLNREYNKHFEKKTMLELQIALQKKLDPKEMSAKKPFRISDGGQPISWQNISRAEHITVLENELEATNVVLETINEAYE